MSLDLETMFGEADIPIECPKCDHAFSVKFNEVLKDKSVVQCPACQADIEVQHDEGLAESVGSANKALSDFEKELGRFGK